MRFSKKFDCQVNQCKVAVCIPSYGNAAFMRRLLDSVKMQGYKDFVVVISDDSVNSDISDLVSEYTGFRLFYSKNGIRLGPTENTNMAMRLAQKYHPEYLKVMHHDDFFSFEDSLSKLVELLEENKEADLAFCGTYEVNETDKFSRKISEEQRELLSDDFRSLYLGNYIGAPSAVIVRNTGAYMDPELVWKVDLEWYMQILNRNPVFWYTEEPLVSIGRSDSQVTRKCLEDTGLNVKESIYIFKKYSLWNDKKYVHYLVNITEKLVHEQEILKYCMRKKNIYIYGAGIKGKECAELLDRYCVEYIGFIVSDEYMATETYMEHAVKRVSEILQGSENQSGIIAAIGRKSQEEVRKTLEERNADYIFY